MQVNILHVLLMKKLKHRKLEGGNRLGFKPRLSDPKAQALNCYIIFSL